MKTAPPIGRPLPVQVPTAFVRVRPRGQRPCGQAKPGRFGCAAPRRLPRQ
ncbi:MAG: hypothetical protein QOE36_3091 [Gaiellaceae bacterium]|jgi:hypothetical protein|nr:hypothetical protein [Gaiellaceae bacterium]